LKEKKIKKSPRRHFFPNHWSKIVNPFFYSYVECIYMLIINNNLLTINFSYITFATAKRKKRSLTTTTTTKTTIVTSRWPKNQRRGRHRRRLGTSASLAKTGSGATDSDATDSDAADSDAADSDAADSDADGIDAAQPGERSPPDPDVALRNPRNSLLPANVAFLLLMLLLFFVVVIGLFVFEQRLNLSFPSTFVDA